MRPRALLAAGALALLAAGAARAQTPPNWTYGHVPTTAEWNAVFAGKQDYLGAPPATLGSNTFTGTQTIHPAAGTTNRGLAIVQTAPSSGTPVGPILFNSVDVTNPGLGASGGGHDNFGGQNLIYGLRATMSITGTTSGAGSAAFGAFTNISAASDGFGGSHGVSITGAGPAGHNAWGHIGYGIVFSGGQIGLLVGVEGEMGVSAGATASFRVGVSSNSQGPVQGSVLDAAFAANTINIAGYGGDAAPWQHLMALSSIMYGGIGFPLAATGDFFSSDTAGTVAHFANLSNVAVTGNVLSFPNLTLAGNGGAIFGAPGTPLAGQMFVTCASCGRSLTTATPNGASGTDGVTFSDSSGNNVLFAGVAEASNTVTRFGQTAGNFALAFSNGSANLGMLLGTVTNKPLIVGTNNTFAGSVDSSQRWELGANAAADARLTINDNTVATAAPTNTPALHIVGANNALTGRLTDAFGSSAQMVDNARLAFGTGAAPTAVNTAANGLTIGLSSLDSTGAYGNNCALDFVATGSGGGGQTGTDHGGAMRARCTAPGTASPFQEVWRASIGFMIGSGLTDPGFGNLNLGGGVLQANGVAPTGSGAYVRATGATMASLTVTGSFTATGLVTNADLASPTTTVNGQACTLGASCTITAAATTISVGTTSISGGTTTRVLFDNAGVLGEYTNAQLTALINPATSSLSGALPAWPNNTATFFRGDGTYAAIVAPAGTLTGATLASNVLASSLTSVGTLTGGATGAGFTVSLSTSTISGALPCANQPALTGDVTTSSCAAALATAQPAVHTWALAQTFTVAPVFTDASGSRTALGLGTMATQSAAAVAITGGTINGTIGGTTPAAGTFTTLTGNTSVTSPLHYGGSSAGSTLTVNGTSNGSPASAYLALQSNGQNVSIGNTSPKTVLDLNANLSNSPALVVSTSLARVQAADAAVGGMEFVSYGASPGIVLAGAIAGGTSASPTATPSQKNMLSLRGYGYNGTTWQAGGLIGMHSVSAWSGSNQGTQIDFYTTPDTTTTLAVAGSFSSSGGFQIGSTLATLAAGELGIDKTTASGSAPGAGTVKIAAVAGTNAGTCKLIMYAGTSTTPGTVLDNVGTGC